MTAVTRTTDEEALRDLNLYLYDDDGEIVLHRYQSSSTLRFTSLPGNYRMRIAANMGRDLGENPASGRLHRYARRRVRYAADVL